MKMRLIQNMSTIAEYPATECPSGRVIKIAVIGGSGVGKTALVVRFLTRRFIGDYERNAGTLYSRQIQIDGEQVAIQVQDTPGVQVNGHNLNYNEQVNRSIQWADAVVLVYSITDCKSFEIVSHLHQQVRRTHADSRIPIIIVANKADLLHVKQVEPHQGQKLANMLGCTFYEVSASENYNDIYNAFHVLCKEISKQQAPINTEKRRSSLIPRPKSPNMQDLKRRFKQALSAKVRTVTSV